MGCCQSTNARPDDAPRPAHPGARIAPPISDGAVDAPPQVDGAGANGARPNKPIRPISPMPKSPSHNIQLPPPWRRSLLERERTAFFDTRVTGRQEVWDALRLACDLSRQGNVEDAQGVLDAANVTSPQGRIHIDKGMHRRPGGVYDERGEIYDIPKWVLADPEDLVEDEEEKDVEGGASDDEDDQKAVQQALAAERQRRQDKGKGRAESPGEMLYVKIRFSDGSPDVAISVDAKHPVAAALRQAEQQSGKSIRLMYLGKSLREDKRLLEQGWQKGHVLNAMVHEVYHGKVAST
ncbi:hypothetical protein LTR36_001080 [Oleoguttula mirabilis]|uniref:DC-UbP/UBTD2 N-terminal domain-containing protein n=1 Tax=Oleoguttula mirabilis TaxID=1507867 RepID=A0AAV9JQE4_9PEZI|nr:hypothetical protein LTR36_001080 [Oleoguttula mirabilis]